MFRNIFRLGGSEISDENSPIIIAEIGINHGGSLVIAKSLVASAVKTGAQIIKHQTHIPEDEMSLEAKSVIPGNSDRNIYDIISECALGENEEYELMEFTKSLGATFISTPFSRRAADRLAEFDIPALKIGSGECTNYPLLEHVISKGKPIILSTGMHSLSEIEISINMLEQSGLPFALMHTTNLYPTPNHLVRLGAITEMRDRFPNIQIGLSDHTESNHAAIGAMALGANIIEKHFVITKEMDGPDVSSSMDVDDLKQLLEAANVIGQQRFGSKTNIEDEQVTRDFAYASVVADADIKAGDILSSENIWVRRPAGGDFHASQLESLYGRVAKVSIANNTQIRARDIQ